VFLAQLLHADQRIVRLAKGIQYHLLVEAERLPLPRLRGRHPALDGAEGEDRPGERRGDRAGARRALGEIVERGAGEAEEAGERERREIKRLRHADGRVRRAQVLLGLQDVRPALKQRGRQSGRDGRVEQLVDAPAARDVARVAANQDREQVLLLRYLALERRDRRLRLPVLRFDLRALHL